MNGRNPIVAHEYLGDSVEGKDIFVADDIISSGESVIDLARELKKRKANRIFAAATFALFTNGLEMYNKAYEAGSRLVCGSRYEQIYFLYHRYPESRPFPLPSVKSLRPYPFSPYPL